MIFATSYDFPQYRDTCGLGIGQQNAHNDGKQQLPVALFKEQKQTARHRWYSQFVRSWAYLAACSGSKIAVSRSQHEGMTMRVIGLSGFLGTLGTLGIVITLANTTVSAQGPGETVKTVFERAIPNTPGKTLIALEVTYAPGGKSPSHFHPKSAFIYAHVTSGAIRSQVGDGPVEVYQAGEGWYEDPGSHHKISENASATEPAKLLAVFVSDPGETLVIPEQK
jgi:quercetin dioxygenase-like cupin family protein